MKANQALVAQSAQTKKHIVNLASGIWTATGYAASNVHFIEGETTITVIDTTETTKAAEMILADFREMSAKPVGRIIYTHSHRDHISGATILCEGQDVPIIASHLFQSDLVDVDQNQIAANKALMRRTMMQFGIGLSGDQRISLGVGPGDRPMEGMGAGYIAPTERVAHDQDIDLDGVQARLIHAPGETDDHLIVWLPEQKILFGGDNWYHAFPNLYAIRGTPYRDFQKWADSLSLMADLGADILAPGHTQPVMGAHFVKEVLTSTRDAILHVMRYTADGMDQGLALDDICASITLPDALADKPWLQEFYGKLSWSARAFAAGTLGWYDGNPTNLAFMPTIERAEQMAKLAGGEEALHKAAIETDNLQWRLELCDHLLVLGAPVHILKAETMEVLAEQEINATARNSYIWAAQELRKHKEQDG